MNKNKFPVLHMIEKMLDIRLQYSEIRQDEAQRPTSTVMGRHAIKYLIVFAISVVCGVAILAFGIPLLDTIGILFGIFIIITGALLLIYSLSPLLLALNCSIKQLKLNKRPIGWVTLTITLIILTAAIVTLAIVLGTALS